MPAENSDMTQPWVDACQEFGHEWHKSVWTFWGFAQPGLKTGFGGSLPVLPVPVPLLLDLFTGQLGCIHLVLDTGIPARSGAWTRTCTRHRYGFKATGSGSM